MFKVANLLGDDVEEGEDEESDLERDSKEDIEIMIDHAAELDRELTEHRQ